MKTEDHSLSALIVKEDGLIYVNRVPEEPELCVMLDKGLKPDVSLGHISCDILGCPCDAKQEEYKKALASATKNAILCADQEVATNVLLRNGFIIEDGQQGHKPGIYPIPDLQWRKEEERPCEDSGTDEIGRKVDFAWVAVIIQ